MLSNVTIPREPHTFSKQTSKCRLRVQGRISYLDFRARAGIKCLQNEGAARMETLPLVRRCKILRTERAYFDVDSRHNTPSAPATPSAPRLFGDLTRIRFSTGVCHGYETPARTIDRGTTCAQLYQPNQHCSHAEAWKCVLDVTLPRNVMFINAPIFASHEVQPHCRQQK